MSEDYRSELAAAHARIAALEDALATTNRGVSDARVKELEQKRAKLAKAAEPGQVRKLAALAALFPFLIFSTLGIGLFLSTRDPGTLFFLAFGTVIGTMFGLLHLFLTPRGTRTALVKMDQELEEARRIVRLEGEVKETRRMLEAAIPKARVATEEPEPEEEAEEESLAKKSL